MASTAHVRPTAPPAPSGPSDVDLVRRVKQRDSLAFDELVRRHQDRIMNACVRMVGDYEDARDLCQETFVKAYRAVADFEERSQFGTWIYRIAINLCLSYHRSGKRSIERPMPHPKKDESRPEHQVPDLSMEPQSAVLGREAQEVVQRAIAQLDDEYRSVIVLREIQGLSYEEVAEVLSVPIGTVRSRLHRAREALKETLSKYM